MIKREEVEASMTLDEAIRVFDLSANRTRPNQQTRAWEVLRAGLIDLLALQDQVDAAPVALVLSTHADHVRVDPPEGIPLDMIGQRIRLVPEADSGGDRG